MRTVRAIIGGIIILLSGGSLLAAERVVRLSIFRHPVGDNGGSTFTWTVSNAQTYELPTSDQVEPSVPSRTFEVYTRQELDSKHTEDAKVIAELQAALRTLRQNLKDLADENDALTKRVDEIEKQRSDKR